MSTHKVTIYIDGTLQSTVTSETSDPETFSKTLVDAIVSNRSWNLFKRKIECITITGNPTIVVPVRRILCYKIEEMQ